MEKFNNNCGKTHGEKPEKSLNRTTGHAPFRPFGGVDDDLTNPLSTLISRRALACRRCWYAVLVERRRVFGNRETNRAITIWSCVGIPATHHFPEATPVGARWSRCVYSFWCVVDWVTIFDEVGVIRFGRVPVYPRQHTCHVSIIYGTRDPRKRTMTAER